MGFAPFMVRSIRLRGLVPYNRILFLGDPLTEFADLIVTGTREEAVRELFTGLERRGGWGETVLRYFSDTSPNFHAVRSLVEERGDASLAEYAPSPYVQIEGRTWQEYLEEEAGKEFVIEGVRRRKRKYAKHEWYVEKPALSELDDTVYADLLRLHESSQRRQNRESVYRDPAFGSFLREVVAAFAGEDRTRLYFLTIDGVRVSFILGFLYDGVFYYWNTGFDSEYHKLSPSKFLIWNLLKDAFETGAWRAFNFMGGGAPYKLHWAGRSTMFHTIRMRRNSGVYRLLNAVRTPTV